MRVRGFEDPVAYAEQVLPFLLRAPARHNLFLGILEHPAATPDDLPGSSTCGSSRTTDEVVGAALQTPPHNIAIAEPVRRAPSTRSWRRSARRASAHRASWVASRKRRRSPMRGAHVRRRPRHDESSRRLRADGDPRRRRGRGRRALATDEDLPLLLAWQADFVAEAVPDHVGDDDAMRRRLTGLVADGGFWLWESGDSRVDDRRQRRHRRRACGSVPSTRRPTQRGHGYATALVAHASASRDSPTARRRCFAAHRSREPDVERDLSADRVRAGSARRRGLRAVTPGLVTATAGSARGPAGSARTRSRRG